MVLLGLSWPDLAAVVVFTAATVGYHAWLGLYAHRHPLNTVRGKVHLYRRTWIRRLLDFHEYLAAVQATRNLLMTASFLASSALLALAFVFNMLLTLEPAVLARFALIDPIHMRAKLALLLVLLGFAFVTLLQALRDLNHFTVLVEADLDLIGHVEPVDGLTYLTNLFNQAAERLHLGQRAFLFTLPVVAWFFGPWAFLAATVAMWFYVATHLDLQEWRPPPGWEATRRGEGEAGR